MATGTPVVRRTAAHISRDPNQVPVTAVFDTASAVEIIHALPGFSRIALDVETDSVSEKARSLPFDPRTCDLRTIQIAGERIDPATGELLEQAWVLDVRDMDRLALGRAIVDAGRTSPHGMLRAAAWFANFDDVVIATNLTGRTGQEIVPIMEFDDLMHHEGVLRLGAVGNDWHASLADAARLRLGISIDGKGTVQLSYDDVSDLTEEQIRYGAVDVIVTLWMAREYDELIAAAGLAETVEIVCGSRPVWNGMRLYGLGFDAEGWQDFLQQAERHTLSLLSRLSELTTGEPLDLVSDEAPALGWNPGSEVDVKRILNEHERERVHAYTGGRDLSRTDSTDADALALIGGELASTIAEWRSWSKLGTTYGQKLIDGIEADGRLHSEFTQNLVATGRGSCRGVVNMQAPTPLLKPYVFAQPRTWGPQPATRTWTPRAFLLGDFSQAELRVIAQLTGEPVMVEAFANGVDMHQATASAMFKRDMAPIKELTTVDSAEDPAYGRHVAERSAAGLEPVPAAEVASWAKAQYDAARSSAKPISFGLPYGQTKKGLAIELSKNGVPTSEEQAQALIDAYYAGLPRNGAWLDARDAFMASVADGFRSRARGRTPQPLPDGRVVPELDMAASWKLHLLSKQVSKARKAAKAALGRKPDAEDIAAHLWSDEALAEELTGRLGEEPSPQQVAAERAARVQSVEWVMSKIGSAVLMTDGRPFAVHSTTIGGRRRLFQLSTESWVTSMALKAATERGSDYVAARTQWEESRGVKLTTERNGRTQAMSWAALRKVFEKKELKLDWVSFVLSTVRGAATYLTYIAAADVVKGLSNSYRNAPIQGSVADAVERCFTRLARVLREQHPTARILLSVHDSIVIEADLHEAVAVREVLRSTMEEALSYYLPDVAVKADCEMAASLDTKHHGIAEADIPRLLAACAAAPGPVPVKELLDWQPLARAA